MSSPLAEAGSALGFPPAFAKGRSFLAPARASRPPSVVHQQLAQMELYVLPGSAKYDLPSLDGPSLVAASYLQLVAPGKWTLVECTDTSLSPNGKSPMLAIHPYEDW